MRRLPIWLSALLLLLTACSSSLPPTPPPELPPDGGLPQPSGAATPEMSAQALFPATDRSIRYLLRQPPDSAEFASGIEQVVRDGDRVIIGSDGKASATWFLRSDGVYRIDPLHGGVLLRYLPTPLQTGAAWKQQSGDAEVWFHLQQGCSLAYTPDAGGCWTLTVLNRGDVSVFSFARERGPMRVVAQNWVRPQVSYLRESYPENNNPLSAETHAAYVAQGVTDPPPPAAVTDVTEAEFAAAAGKQLLASVPNVTPIDLDGDGRNEYIQGRLNDWTAAPIQLLGRDTTVIRALKGLPPDFTAQRLRPVVIGQQRWLLYEVKRDGRLMIALLSPAGVEVWGWAPKATYTEGTRVEVDGTGKVTLWWALDDPARHLWVREYQLDPAQPHLTQTASRFTPQEQGLRYPTTPADLLYAAFFAQWYELKDELPRYFAKPESAAALAPVKPALYGHGTVELGVLTLKDLPYGDRTVQEPQITPGPIGADGTVSYRTRLGSYETSLYTWGQVTFGTDPQGRPVILKLTIEGTSEIM